MSYISVTFKIIIPQNYKDVVAEYNKIKPLSWQPISNIEHVDTVGGFEIPISTEDDNSTRCRAKKQVSWHQKGLLRTNPAYNPFSDEEVYLLYNAMTKVFGTDKIAHHLRQKIEYSADLE